jgi:hypothetical protein
LLVVGSPLAAGCGGDGGDVDGGSTLPASGSSAPSGSLEALWRAPGEDVAIVPGTSDYGPGRERVSFLVVDGQGKVISSPTARVWISRALKAEPFQQVVARSEPIGVPGGDEADAQELYVAHLDLPEPGKYWLLAEPVKASKKIQAIGNIVVRASPQAPAIGERAIPSKTPTADTVAEAREVTTARPVDLALLGSSVAQALAAKAPFVVSFATPKFCSSRTCGPVVQTVQAVERRMRGSGVRFIHVEIYEGNDPANGVNRWVDQWHLPTEPFTFVVDRTGVITTKLEGAFSVRELEAAARRVAR